jgi:catechol 2,3-dioxygenase-like lactoylglutathione lyase family enzyme
MDQVYDRAAADIGNIIGLEHVNTTIDDQRLATLFYVVGLGFTRDPYLSVGDENMWINLGRQQFHLPTRGRPQVLRGHVGVVVPDLEALKARLAGVRQKLAETRFSFAERNGHVATTCPWGNDIRVYAPQERFGDMKLGMPYVELTVPRGAAAGIARFYQRGFGAKAKVVPGEAAAIVPAGRNQTLVFRETDSAIPPFDGHHIAIYVADFSGPHRFLLERGLVTEESNPDQYRFRDIVDPDSGNRLFELEHEVRSLRHPMYGRPFVNRNPAQVQRTYVRGYDAFVGDT